ncbi:TPR-like protein [Metschnikowia bicuspidata]|uniref:TPR-like protein n=1 Tax=Metschnikowia bicuspidata TaxID=27322 RepID=A0A4P9ZCB2_9ASCO|nr:TPR-like protein [Metschnikowia bicuspidata]
MGELSFLNQEPPPGYVGGLGRGATGFVTSAETGPVAFLSAFGFEADAGGADGSDGGLFSVKDSAENAEADQIYEQIEERVRSRKKKKKKLDAAEKSALVDLVKAKLKQELNAVSILEWMDLPEAGDLTRRNKRQRLLEQQQQRMYATPDVLIARASGKHFDTAVASDGQETESVNENESAFRETNSTVINFAADPEKERQILASFRRVEPKNANLWISSARYEEQAKQFQKARKFIREGCTHVPENEDVWLENIRLHRSEGVAVARAIVTEALEYNGASEKLWWAAVDLENATDMYSRKRLLLKALDAIPHNTELWSMLVDLVVDSDETETPEKVRLLSKATKMCPGEWRFWELLLSLSDYQASKAILNNARKLIPKDERVWFAALRLEENEHPDALVERLQKMLDKGRTQLEQNGAELNVDWLRLAVDAQQNGCPKTATAIVLEDMPLLHARLELDALLERIELLQKESPDIAVTAYELLTVQKPQDLVLWTKYLRFSRTRGPAELFPIYDRALQLNGNEALYLWYANDKHVVGGLVQEAKDILQKGTVKFPQSELLWTARVDLEIASKQYHAAETLFRDALSAIGSVSARIWHKHVHFLRFASLKLVLDVSPDMILAQANEALERHADNIELHIQKAQVLHSAGKTADARSVVQTALKSFPTSAKLWRELAHYDGQLYGAPKARSLLDKATMLVPDLPELWVAKVELECAEKDYVVARQLVSKALKMFPKSAELWVTHLRFIPKASHRKVAFNDALRETDNSPEILSAIGVFLWTDGKHDKAKTWFERAVDADCTNGDFWGWLYECQRRHGTVAEQQKVVSLARESVGNITSGAVWRQITCDPANLDLSVEELLPLVGEKLLQETEAL